MQEYVAGFMFNSTGERVALVLKNRPAWQAGNYNAIGGKVEPGETPDDAMIREYHEEAGVMISWQHRFTLQGQGYKVYFYSCFDDLAIDLSHTKTDEPIEVWPTMDLPKNTIFNLKWIIPMLLDPSIKVPTVIEDVAGN